MPTRDELLKEVFDGTYELVLDCLGVVTEVMTISGETFRLMLEAWGRIEEECGEQLEFAAFLDIAARRLIARHARTRRE